MLRFGNRGFEKRVTEVEWPFLMTEYLPAVASYIYSFLDTFAWFFDRTMQLRANRISGDVFEGNSVGEQLTPLTGRRRSVPALSPDIFLQKKIYCIDDSGVVPLVNGSYSL
jgi:hypothetical protein